LGEARRRGNFDIRKRKAIQLNNQKFMTPLERNENISAYFLDYIVYENISDETACAIAGALTIPRDPFPQIVDETDFTLNVCPTFPIIKMSKSAHIDHFFNDGSLRLGSFKYFNEFDHPEIGDPTEGSFILVGKDRHITAFAQIAGGFNYLAFCCFAGELDQSISKEFNYDSAFEIVDIEGFADAVQSVINSTVYLHGECLYSKNRIIRGSANGFDFFSTMSNRLLDLVSEAKFFLKPIHLSHQSEFRFLWKMNKDFSGFLDIKVPEAIKYCRRIL
jgi:hypothetical protein